MCGIAMIRLLKPLDYYQKKYGTWEYGLQKMYLLMEKQHNRGQEGAGIATVKLDMPPGEEYISRKRIEGKMLFRKFLLISTKITRWHPKFTVRMLPKQKFTVPLPRTLFGTFAL
jgi:amidophosphoribosyltransferase